MNKSLNQEVFLSFLLPQNVPVSLNCIVPFTDCNDNFPCPFKDLTPEKKDPFRGEPPRVGPLWGVPTGEGGGKASRLFKRCWGYRDDYVKGS